METTRIQRQLVGSTQIELLFTGKGLDFHSLEHVRTELHNTQLSLTFSDHSPSWAYSNIASSPVLSDESTFVAFLSYSFDLEPGTDTRLSKRSCRLKHFIPSFFSIKELETPTLNTVDSSQRKQQLANMLQYVADHHSLLRDPFIFVDAFQPVIDALQSPSHECRKDLYSIPALLWYIEIRLAHFYRRVRLTVGPSDPREMRNLFVTEFVEPFVNMTSDVLTQYMLDRSLQLGLERKGKGADPLFTVVIPSSPTIAPPSTPTAATPQAAITPQVQKLPLPASTNLICKFGLAEALGVTYPNSSNVPTCRHPAPCPVKPHPDYATISKEDLITLINSAKDDFKGPTWTVMFESILTAAQSRA